MNQKIMDLQELIDVGYLFEANRQFFHPLGLELSISFDDDGNKELIVIDGRDIPEGLKYDELSDEESNEKNKNIMNIVRKRFPTRTKYLGFTIQPIILPISNPIPEKYRELTKRIMNVS
jgi:hypothetical protein